MTAESIIRQVTDICRSCGVKHLALFGSYAKGTWTKYSDMDFIVSEVPDMDELEERIDAIDTLTKIDLFEYERCENRFLKEDMKRYARKIY